MLSGGLGERVLDLTTRWLGPLQADYGNNDPYTTSRLRTYFGEATLRELAGSSVIDVGCGRGADAVALAVAGASRVVGIDLDEDYLQAARRCAADHGVAERCRFINAKTEAGLYRSLERFDAAVSIDAFEHFAEPAAILAEMAGHLRPGGRAFISFGPPWKHPFGAHMNHFNRLPWIHFFFAETTIMRVRRRYTDDGATRFEDVPGGLNRMTIARFEALVAASGFAIDTLQAVPIRRLRSLGRHRALREYVTSVVHAELRKR